MGYTPDAKERAIEPGMRRMLLSEIAGCLREIGRHDSRIEVRCKRIASEVEELAGEGQPRPKARC